MRMSMIFNVVFLTVLLMSSGTALAQNKPCSGKKGGVSHCMGKFFVCKDGSISQSKRVCS